MTALDMSSHHSRGRRLEFTLSTVDIAAVFPLVFLRQVQRRKELRAPCALERLVLLV